MAESTIKDEKILEVEQLRTWFPVKRGILNKHVGDIKAVDGLNFFVRRGETLGLVGESGCGKSTTGRSILQLIRPTSGSVKLEGTELTTIDGEDLRSFRRKMQMVFQDPYSSLNPRMSVADIVSEPMMIHGLYKGQERIDRVDYLLESVGLNPFYAKRFPHEFSGGQRQRIGIARALYHKAEVLVFDEATSSLDGITEKMIMEAIHNFSGRKTIILIAHRLKTVEKCDQIFFIDKGKVADQGTYKELIEKNEHFKNMAIHA
jgi:ABC-type glutathione transport system ATPase component